ncbi:predicted protein [Sclerotinia sclerotiorum 1980 UF-70]|uniref:Uncharacterized protein n=2 Tax=Sclerotinia sclerotiorum (strain ATCC 18683 / 1980 / Ss-1) TaxID=665079 RepID=A7F453_SCLS1|nr:predicted protein [Sclerotinia sclerotiorum 1980 UF-70]APA10752.1 hypothetical protein sscle_06g055220 [Sclerotinia sclerotiorum 1980 UF-70]EDN97524.1 predicted protein [Sclerotinia sclerotiorum 1980 UF-70]
MIMEIKDHRILETPLCPAVDVNIENIMNESPKECSNLKIYALKSSNGIGDFSWKRSVLPYGKGPYPHYANVNHHPALTVATSYFGLCLSIFTIASHHKGGIDVQCTMSDFWPTRSWICMIPASFASAVALPLFMEALTHMSSLPVLVMLFH